MQGVPPPGFIREGATVVSPLGPGIAPANLPPTLPLVLRIGGHVLFVFLPSEIPSHSWWTLCMENWERSGGRLARLSSRRLAYRLCLPAEINCYVLVWEKIKL